MTEGVFGTLVLTAATVGALHSIAPGGRTSSTEVQRIKPLRVA